jgi:pyrroline-5-carboxylate reductase
MKKIVVIGVGAMGSALIAAVKSANPELVISVLDKDQSKVASAISSLNVLAGDDAAIMAADLIVLAVKPQDLLLVLEELNPKLNSSQTVLSIAAGIKLAKLATALSSATAVRCMPNTPALVGRGFSTISVLPNTDQIHLDRAISFLAPAGKTMVIAEELQDSFTAIHGSGPAYVFLLIEALVAAAEEQGISTADATAAVIETIAGAAELIAKTGESASLLRERVTSPGGTTQAALGVFAEGGFSQLVAKAVAAAKQRAAELG